MSESTQSTDNNADVQVRKGASGDRFEVVAGGDVAGFAQFFEHESKRVFFHTEVGEEYGGRGLAGILVREALDATRADGLRVVPVCPYVKKFVEKNADEYGDIVDQPTAEVLDKLRG